MMMNGVPVVFAGLSLSDEEARRLISADIRPPVKRGDLDRLSDGRVVAIIDGELGLDSMLPVDEVRRCLDRGITILGAASIGALRAYEARAEGMKGYGWVYEAYCANKIVGTDEIAVAYQPYSRRPLTVPLVDIRFCLDRLVRQTKITSAEAASAMEALKAIKVEDRNRRNVFRSLVEMFGRTLVHEALAIGNAKSPRIKKLDAYGLLRTAVSGYVPKERADHVLRHSQGLAVSPSSRQKAAALSRSALTTCSSR
jgi:hypothetical protein